MSKMRVVVLGLAVGSAVLAGFMAKNMMGKKAMTEVVEINKVETLDVLIASKDVLMGEKLAGSAVSWQPWPKANVFNEMITRDEKPEAVTEYAEARARLAIYSGEPVLEKKLVLPGQAGFMSAMLPKGMRAISVGISEHTSAGGFILPNDRVDVILTRKIENADQSGQKPVVSEIVLSNVRVLAINQTYRQEGEDKVTVAEGKTATLELDSRQTEVIAMTESLGELSLALRSIAENEGKPLSETGPRLAQKYLQPGATGNDMLVLRYGTQSYTSNR
ncbi:MAG: Flp pilus assembly protein CpaB [Aestuariivirga sp.]